MRPGRTVTATPSSCRGSTPARASASSTTGRIAWRCARLAISGTTPPNLRCSGICEATTEAKV